jgi:hypothetical protein
MFLPVPLFVYVYPYSAARRHRDLVILVRGAANTTYTSVQSIGFDNRSVTRLVSRGSNSRINRTDMPRLLCTITTFYACVTRNVTILVHKLPFCQVAVLLFQLAHMSVRFRY